jgi:hypothetical protein
VPAACTWPRPIFGVSAVPTGRVDRLAGVALPGGLGYAVWVFVGGDALQELVASRQTEHVLLAEGRRSSLPGR